MRFKEHLSREAERKNAPKGTLVEKLPKPEEVKNLVETEEILPVTSYQEAIREAKKMNPRKKK